MSPRKRKTQPTPSGGAYSNRTDKTQPVQVATGQPYGQAQVLEQSQQGAPLPQEMPMDQILAAAQGHNFNPVGLNAPTQRPYEPTTHGLPIGPGGGSEVLRQRRPTTSIQLKQLAMSTGDTTFADMAAKLEAYGL